MVISIFDKPEHSVRKAENAGYQHFLIFSQCFQKPSIFKMVKIPDCVIKAK